MKSINSVFTRTVCMIALVSFSNSFAKTMAQGYPQLVVAKEAKENIQFVSVEGEMLIFELRLNNILLKGSVIRILDGDNNIIFEEKTNEGTYSIRYKIVRNDMRIINFQVYNKNYSLNQSFNITSVIEEKIEVKKA